VDFLISSGSLISLSALDKIGKFDEGLFIDHVDTDWCLRTRAHGFRLCGVGRARLNHTFGEATLSMGPGASYRFVLYSPERNYTLVRNSIVLWRRPHAPWRWILYDVRRTLLIILFNILFAPPRKDRIRQIAWAVRDALTSGATMRTGKMEN
jgi:rhamnosyltransferase